MANMLRYPVVWTGLTGLPGVSVFYGPAASVTVGTNLVAFFNAIKGFFPNSLSWVIPASGDVIQDSDGALNGTWSQAGGTVVATGGASPTYAAGVGGRVRWNTNGVVHGRRVRGSTFLTGLTTTQYESNGTLLNASLATIQTAANALVASNDLLIWSRPFAGSLTVPARVGSSYVATGATVPDQVTSLRSRRL